MKPIAIDLFAGAGGISEGLKDAGFRIAFANEFNKRAAETYAYNHPDAILDRRDIREVSGSEIMERIDRKVTLLAGGPPCQGFSLLGRRNPDDPRNSLVWEFVRLVVEIRPKYFLMENVPGILSINGGGLGERIIESFSLLGYNSNYVMLNSSDFGVPQRRTRVFFFGSRGTNMDLGKAKFRKKRAVSLMEAIGDLDFLKNGGSSEKYLLPPQTPYQSRMRRGSDKLFNHEATMHSRRVIRRFSRMRPGENITSLPKGLRIRKRTMYRLAPDRPARTMSSLPDDYVHYRANRILTVREIARIQSFRDSYVFLNRRTTGGSDRSGDCPQYTQVANSVPPFMIQSIGEWILGD
jgi:DNA (cytosine-5)-methyltransferase 1